MEEQNNSTQNPKFKSFTERFKKKPQEQQSEAQDLNLKIQNPHQNIKKIKLLKNADGVAKIIKIPIRHLQMKAKMVSEK